MKKFAVIVAGGAGTRMGTAVPKQFLIVHEHPVLWHTLETFLKAYEDLRIILVVPAACREMATDVLESLSEARRVELVDGGDSRFHSVRAGLERIRGALGRQKEQAGQEEQAGQAGQEGPRLGIPPGESAANESVGNDAIIFVHDGVRCLVNVALVRRCYEQALQVGSAIPVVDCRDSVRLAEEERRSKPIDRSRIKLVQTPQTFRGDILLNAYLQDHQEAFTDEATVVEVAGNEVYLIEGETSNIKITTPQDLVIAEALLRSE